MNPEMKYFPKIYKVWLNELKLIFKDKGVMIFFFILPLAYPIVYTLIYNPEVLKKIPVAVVDDCRTSGSRELTRMLNATSAADVIGIAANMGEARQWMNEKKCYAIMHIPQDYSRDIGRGTPVRIPVYCDMSLLLRYRTLGFALTDIQLEKGAEIRAEIIDAAGLGTLPQADSAVENQAFILGDKEQGFASFVMPGIVILILQQSMVLGIAMLAGGASERRRKSITGTDPLETDASPVQSITGKVLAYFLLYIPSTLYILHYLPEMFSLPHTGSPLQYLPFVMPMLLASALFGMLIGQLFIKEREMSFIAVVFTSVLFLFLSGLTWPRYAMSPIWIALGEIIPAVQGVDGFIRINSNAATLAENIRPYIALWILTAFYFLLNLILLYHRRRKGAGKRQPI